MAAVKIIETDKETIARYPMCGYKNLKNEGYKKKVLWLQKHFKAGMHYDILFSEKDGAVGGIEYIKGAHSWRGLTNAKEVMVIHCLYIMSKAYKNKGYGQLMLDQCIKNTKKEQLKGIAVVTRKGSWMAGSELFIKNKFQTVDTAPPDFQLMALMLDAGGKVPQFHKNPAALMTPYQKGLFMLASDQCPYVDKAIKEIGEAAKKELKIPIKIIIMDKARDAQLNPCAFGSFSIIYNGKVIADHPVSKTRFLNIMRSLA